MSGAKGQVDHVTTSTGSTATSPSRLPVAVQLPDRRVEVAKGLVAFVATALVVVGLPVLLASTFGAPWPDSRPSWEWVTEPTTAEVMLGVLAAVVWLGWAHFVVCLMVEAVAERRHRGMARHVPGGGIGTQTLARRAIATIVLVAGTSAMGVSTASAAVAAAHPSASAQQLTAAVDHARGRTDARNGAQPSGQPERQAGAGAGVEARRPAADTLLQATRADQRSDVTTYYDVKPPNGRRYDTLWDIAERYLGDGLRYKEIWQLNKDVLQPDGRTLKDADLIYPGWVMRLPDDAKGAGLKVVDHTRAAAPGSPRGAAAAAGVSVSDASGDLAGSNGAAATAADDEGSLVPAGLAPFLGVTGGMALAGAALALRRRRASYSLAQLWAARTGTGPGTDPTDPTPDGPGAGSRLVQEADEATAAWLNGALRSWNGVRPVPAPSTMSLGTAGLVAGFEEAPEGPAPEGWSTHAPEVWTLSRDASVGGSGPAPLPGLVSIGLDDDGAVRLIDLESTMGVVAVDGVGRDARGVAMSMAVDTGTHLWADERVVTLVGFSDDVTAVAPDRIRRVSDLRRVLERLENLAAHQRRACRDAGSATVRDARAARPDLDWAYHLVVCSGVPSAEDLAALDRLARDPQVSLGVVVVGAVPDAATRLTVREDGRLVSPLLGIDVVAQMLDVETGRELAALNAVPAAAGGATLDDLVDALHCGVRTAPEAVVQVGVLGPVTVAAPGEVDEDRRAFLTELGAFLALHPTGVHVNRVAAALWPRGVDPAVRDTALAQLVRWWGSADDGSPVLAERSGVWSVTPGTVRLDWDDFRAALNDAAHDGRRRERHLRRALDLVAGPTMSEVPQGRYAWVESTSLPGDSALAVAMTAQALAQAALDRDDADAARTALERGLRLLPANEDLWRSRLQVEAGAGDRAALVEVADRLYAAVAEHGSPVGAAPQTDALVDELLPGYRSLSGAA
jgi:DNA-binding SARP family transcriptional activator